MMPGSVCLLEFGWLANLGDLLKIMRETRQFGFLPRSGHTLKPNWKSCLAIFGRDRNGRIATTLMGSQFLMNVRNVLTFIPRSSVSMT
jgi:hypothetical protein